MVTSHSTPPQTPAMVGSCGFLRQLWSFTHQPWMDLSSTQSLYLPLNPCKRTHFKRCCEQRKWVRPLEKVTKCYKMLRCYQQLTTERSGSSIHSCTPSTEAPPPSTSCSAWLSLPFTISLLAVYWPKWTLFSRLLHAEYRMLISLSHSSKYSHRRKILNT